MIGTETAESDVCNDHETTNSKSVDVSSEVSELDKVLASKKRKAYPVKIGNGEASSKRIISDKNENSHQVRAKKRKYFTKYMSNEFSKDIRPVSMNEMDVKTQMLFKDQEFNELVSEITGMN